MTRKAKRPKPADHEPGCEPLRTVAREFFAQAVAKGAKLEAAYRQAGYKGNDRSRQELRADPDVDDRIKWLLRERIRADAEIRAAATKREGDARARLIKELEAVAYVDPGDLMQWDTKPVFNAEGEVVGSEDTLSLTPSKFLTKAQRSAVKMVQRTVRKDGTTVRIDTNGKLEALALLAKVLGIVAVEPSGSTTINNTQVNVTTGEGTALDAARRLAFALEKAARALPQPMEKAIAAGPILDLEAVDVSHASSARSKG